MTPEQIERLRESLSGLTSDEAFVEVAVYDLRALLAEWEERSAFAKEADRCWHAETMAKLKAEAEIERLKADIAWQEERNANNVRAYTEEIERLKAEQADLRKANLGLGKGLAEQGSKLGREIERLRASTLPDVVPEDVDALKAEIERLFGELQTETAERIRCRDGWANAEARLAKVIEVGDRIVARNCGDAEAELWAKAKEKE